MLLKVKTVPNAVYTKMFVEFRQAVSGEYRLMQTVIIY